MAEKIHVLFLAKWYPSKYDPMLGLFVQRHAEAAAIHNQVSVVYAHLSNDKLKSKFEVDANNDHSIFTVKVYYQSAETCLSPWNKLLNLIRFYTAIGIGIRHVKQVKGSFDLIHVHVLTRLALVAYWFQLFYQIPYMVTEHWSRYLPVRNEFHGFFRKMLTKMVVKRARIVTTVTQNLANAMQQHGLKSSHYFILPNVVDVNLFKPVEKKNKKPRFIHISCFEDRSKNISGLLRVSARLKELDADFECILIGEGMDDAFLKDYALSLGLDGSNIRFTGLLEGVDLAETLAFGDFLVLFSNYENLPVVILEAFACGLPVVSTSVGGIPEMVNTSNGLLVKAGDEEGLLQAIVHLKNKVSDYNSDEIRALVVNKNSKESVGLFLDQCYREALGSAVGN
ncbi:MAG: hypothetical protein CVT92_16800 [Bacteroidetes bacterium HGW-Bacteroidetes-1]|jgi:glycosyltransferase involved in cell wall biosynthesis|nr:MAG: hypothetical protein CVT92_16800 [Bacteroidetes bacterium HGW-Bacteroidetes-1]